MSELLLPPPTYSLLVSNVGWVYNNHPDYDFILAEFEYYKATYQTPIWMRPPITTQKLMNNTSMSDNTCTRCQTYSLL